MEVLKEAKEIMKLAGCNKIFAVYELKLGGIAEVRGCNSKEEFLELEKRLENLSPTIDAKLNIDIRKPIECPLDPSMNKYLEFNLKNKTIKPCNVDSNSYKEIQKKINPLIEEYNWNIIDK